MNLPANMITQAPIPLYEQLVDDFAQYLPTLQQSEEEQLLLTRRLAFDRFRSTGFPTTRLEDWKHTNILPFLKDEYDTANAEDNTHADPALVNAATIKGLDCYTIVLMNGSIVKHLSTLPSHPKVAIAAISEKKNDPVFLQYFAKDNSLHKHAFASLNTALFSDGLFIEIGAGVMLDKPIHVIHTFSAEASRLMQARHLYIVHPHASAAVIESTVSNNNAGLFVNSVTEVQVKQHAQMDLYTIQHPAEGKYLQHTEVSQEANSVFSSYTYSFPGAAFLRNNLHIGFEGEHAEGNLYGLYLTARNQLVDNHTLVDHRLPNCNSNEWYKGLMLDSASAVFNGKIKVHRDAQKTNAFQKNNNLLISQKSRVNTKPELEIYADDVKCSHGCTVGQFDEDALFYLKSRGIGEVMATGMLMEAFAWDITSKIKFPELQAHVRKLKGLWVMDSIN
jgi:Fe-S cluster assembly protein SufD